MFEKFKKSENFAFTRFSDGELRILQNVGLELAPGHNVINGIKTKGRYAPENLKSFVPERDQFYKDKLFESCRFKKKNYYAGLCCRCCVGDKQHQQMLDWYEGDVTSEFLTWSNLLLNSNYPLFMENFLPEFKKKKIVLICNKNCNIEKLPFKVVQDFRVGPYCMRNDYDLIETVKTWIKDNDINDHVFLFSAASLSNFMIHQLFDFNDKNTYIDIGSTLNNILGIDNKRGYLRGGRTTKKTCVW